MTLISVSPRSWLAWVRVHPRLTGTLALILSLAGFAVYRFLNTESPTAQYQLAEAHRSTLSVTVNGSGQVSAESQIEVTARASGDITSISASEGASIKRGAIIAYIDSREAQKAVRNAEVSLQSAKLALQKLSQPATALERTQAENALTDSTNTLAKAYDDGFNEVSNTFLALPAVMTGLDDILNDEDITPSQDNVYAYTDMIDEIDPRVTSFRDDALTKYKEARAAYEKSLVAYKKASRFSDTKTIEALIIDAYDMTKTVAESAKSVSDFLNLVNDSLTVRERTIPTVLTEHRAALTEYIGDTNTQLVALLSIKDTVTSSKQLIAENTEALKELERGADPLDIASQELTVKERENALQDARENLADYAVRAPFDGTVAEIFVKRSDDVGSGTPIATIITEEHIAEISLNEIDVAAVAVGQEALLTFDAAEDVRIKGTVASVDTIGTVESGVVTYIVTISFPADARIKPGMSVNADITTKILEDALVVPASAVKNDREGSYVEVVDGATLQERGPTTVEGVSPRRVGVAVGISNDRFTEIVSGIEEGTIVVSRTIATSEEATAQAPSIFQAAGARPPGTGGGGQGRPQGTRTP